MKQISRQYLATLLLTVYLALSLLNLLRIVSGDSPWGQIFSLDGEQANFLVLQHL